MLVTFSDTCGLSTFMVRRSFLRNKSKYNDKKKGLAALPAAVLAAVFPEVVGELAKGTVVGGVVMERPLATCPNDARINEPFEVMAQAGGRHVQVRLNRPGGGPFGPRLDHVAQDCQSNRMSQSAELLGVAIQFSFHESTSIIFE